MRLNQTFLLQVQHETSRGVHHGALEVVLPAELHVEVLPASAMEADDTAVAAAAAQERVARADPAINPDPVFEAAERRVVPAAGDTDGRRPVE